MKIAVFGLGYVGSVSAACLAQDGHDVIGVDPNPVKVQILNEGRSPVIEPGLNEVVAAGVVASRLRATDDVELALDESEVGLVCVGTPSHESGRLDLTHIEMVSRQIGESLASRRDGYTIILRSTVLPGTTRDVVIPILEEASGKKAGTGYEVVFNPEFLREGSSVGDYYDPPKIVVGTLSGDPNQVVADLFEHLDAPRVTTTLETAELAKYVDNAWHALKVVFANEVGRISQRVRVDAREVMDIFVQDTKLNISSKYLRPGFAYGGSCLPKDLMALQHRAQELDVDTPVLRSISWSNDHQIDLAFRLVTASDSQRIGILGLSFKAGTDDLRNSPMVEVVERLIGKGYDLRIYDPNVQLASLVGANKDYILQQIPHISGLLVGSALEALRFGETIVVATAEAEFVETVKSVSPDQEVVDLVGVVDPASIGGRYRGIAW